jgi:hypothetical protein
VTVTTTGPEGTPADAINSPTATVNLRVLTTMQPAEPTGVVDTPVHLQTGVTGSLPVTGWAIDDVGVTRVRIYRDGIAGEAAASCSSATRRS